MSTSLRVRPGESERVVLRITRGTNGEVLARRGRWIKVRVGKKRGWLTRTTVTQRITSDKRTRKRGWKQDDRRRKRWMTKRSARRAAVATAPRPSRTARAATDIDPDTSRAPAPAVESPPTVTKPLPQVGPRGVFGSVRVGASSLSMDFTSDGSAGIASYLISTRAAAVHATAGAEAAVGALRVTAEANYRFTGATPGIHYESSNGASGDMAFTGHEVDASVAAGTRVSRSLGGVVALARAGYTYSALLFDRVDNAGMLPSEDLRGGLVGGELTAPRAWSGTAVRARVDVLVAGRRGQTAGLEDGAESAVDAWWLSAGLSRAAGNTMSLDVEYRYHTARTEWTGPSTRQSDVMSARRIDEAHAVTLGLSGAF